MSSRTAGNKWDGHFRKDLVCLVGCLVIGSTLFNQISFAQETTHSFAPCTQCSSPNASISLVGAPATLILKPTRQRDKPRAVGHIYVRNDGTVPLSQWCATVYSSDYQDQPRTVVVSLGDSPSSETTACQVVNVPPGEIQDLALSIDVDGTRLPISGMVTISAKGFGLTNGNSKQDKQDQKDKTKADRSGLREERTESEKCQFSTKQISQNIIVSVLASASHASTAMFVTALAASGFLAFCLSLFWRSLNTPMGASQWSFSSSTATNLTLVGSLLGAVLTSTALPDYPHYMTKQSYIVLSLLFAVLAGLAPTLYNLCCKPTVAPDNPQIVNFEGTVFLFLAADAITIWAALGQLTCLSLLFAEFAARKFVSTLSVWSALPVALAVAVALLTYSFRVVRFYVEEYPARTQEAPKEAQVPEAALAPTKSAPRWAAL